MANQQPFLFSFLQETEQKRLLVCSFKGVLYFFDIFKGFNCKFCFARAVDYQRSEA